MPTINLTKKNKIFKKTLPDDTALHRLCRRTELIDSLSEFNDAIVALDPDKITDAESNLRPHILKKILYKSGLNIGSLDNYESTLNKVVNIRNAIAHGAQRRGIKKIDYDEYEKTVHNTEDGVKKIILNAVKVSEYLEK